MVILGGLEIVIGGYLIHRHQKNKNEKRRLEDEANARRQNTFPGGKSSGCCPTQQQPAPPIPQKYAYYAPPPQQPPPPPPPFQSRPQASHTFPQTRPYPQHTLSQPQLPPHRQPSYRKPVPQQHQVIQPLGRSDSMASTFSTIPVADGYRPGRERPQQSSLLSIPPSPQANHPYSNAGFSVSTPSFAPAPLSPAPYTPAANRPMGRHTVDDNWETYGPQSPHVHFAVAGPQPGDSAHDPPPPYRP